MNDEERESMLKISQTLVDKGEYHRALAILEAMDCVMAYWLKGIIFFSFAEELSKSFMFIFYITNEMKERYKILLNKAYDNFYKAAHLLPNASLEVRNYLNQYLWHKISRVEHEIARTNGVNCSISFDDDFEENDTQQNTDYLVNQVIDWSL